jgi:hypothetical protein
MNGKVSTEVLHSGSVSEIISTILPGNPIHVESADAAPIPVRPKTIV